MKIKIELIHDNSLENYRKVMEKLKERCVRVGWFDNTKYDDKNESSLVSKVARTQEFGTISRGGFIPPRPFMRPAKNHNQNKWKTMFANLVKEHGMEQALKMLGIVAVGDIRKAIMEVWMPPLKESTIRNRLRRYSDKNQKAQDLLAKIKRKEGIPYTNENKGIMKPLVDTGLMIASLSYEVLNTDDLDEKEGHK